MMYDRDYRLLLAENERIRKENDEPRRQLSNTLAELCLALDRAAHRNLLLAIGHVGPV